MTVPGPRGTPAGPIGVYRGRVERGDQRGRLLGFPTANLRLERTAALRDGVYAGWYSSRDVVRWPAAVSVGSRPTFYRRGSRLLEANLLDFEGDLYGQLATIELVIRLRPQRRFDDVSALTEQLLVDASTARDLLATAHA